MGNRRNAMRDLRNETLARFLASPGRFAVYGAGDTGESVVRALGECGLKPSALLDSYVTGERLGLAILPPEEALGLDAVVTAGRHARDMTVQLRADGFEGPVLDLTALHRAPPPAHFDEARLDAAADAIGFARSLIEDDGSRAVFDAVLRHRRSLDPGELPPAPPHPGHPAVPVRDGEWVIDVGSDEAARLELAEAVGPLGRVLVLEPSPARREALAAAAAMSAVGARIAIHALGCGAACLPPDEGDEDAVAVVTVDEFVWETTSGRVDRVRFARDGAEATPSAREVVNGASATLSEHRPCLEIDLSGAADDLWEVPIRLKERLPSYRVHLAHHSQGLGGTVAYARAPEGP
ncbi:MAG TPA: hypothetical protein VKB65_04555 [Myxococcota bacterium]|nr:hypothetical protein [Myxococcota bacterium]